MGTPGPTQVCIGGRPPVQGGGRIWGHGRRQEPPEGTGSEAVLRACHTHRGWEQGKKVRSVEEGPQGRWQATPRQGHATLQPDPTHPPGDARLNSRQKLFLPRGRRGERQWGPATWRPGLGLRSWATGSPPSSSVSPCGLQGSPHVPLPSSLPAKKIS